MKKKSLVVPPKLRRVSKVAKQPKQVGIDPDLRKRRLATLIRLLEKGAADWRPRKGELTRQEMLDWSRQVTNLLNSL